VEERVMRHVLIVGLPGVGKSKLLEMCRVELPHVACFDLDRELERELGLAPLGLTDWILNHPTGMDRQRELATLVELLSKNSFHSCIISLGSGALDLFIDQKKSLSELGSVSWLYLEAELELILDQLMQDRSRPHAKLGDRQYWQKKLQNRVQYFANLPQVYRCQLEKFDIGLVNQMLQ
jgi:shikimate kinase